MCYCPITIKNPKLVKTNVIDKSLLEVPCGHCHACKEEKRLSWFVRLYYEWQYCTDNNGFALYETLTYNNEHLPFVYDYFNGKKVVKCFPCFSRHDVQKYIKRIRKQLTILGYAIDFKYFLSMEYGGKTHRPHYHILFFVSSPNISPWFFKKIVEGQWLENGFVKAGKFDNGFVSSTGALSYCSKYVCKDVYEDKYFKILEKRMMKMGFNTDSIKNLFPRVMCSQNLGIYALEFDNNNDLENFFLGEVALPDKELGIKKYKLPLYYERKIFYDVRYRFFDSRCNDYLLVSKLSDLPNGVEYTPIYVLNDLGLEMQSKRAKIKLEAVRNVFRIVTSLPSCDDFILKLNNKFNTKFKNINEFQQFIKAFLREEDFVSYSLVYRGCHCSINDISVHSRHNTPYYDYLLVHNISRGFRPLSVDMQGLCYNIIDYNSLPYIEDIYSMIRYFYKLISLKLEQEKQDIELNYVEQKSAYLAENENNV